jgi:hypothetical protein
MVAARKFNEAAGRMRSPVYGGVTTGETWQFLRLADQAALLNRDRYYLDNVSGILAMFQAICQDAVTSGRMARQDANPDTCQD